MADFNGGKPFDFERGFTIDFDLNTGLSKMLETDKRKLSQLRGMFSDDEAYEKKLAEENDPLIYEFHSMPAPATSGDFCFGCSILNPGKIGNEYYFTKGHFHNIVDTGEIYYCLKGHGYMMMENMEGDWDCLELTPNRALYVPKGYAHRSINVSSDEKLRTFFVYRADAGHNYGTIEEKGYRHLLVEREGKPAVIDNPKWKQEEE